MCQPRLPAAAGTPSLADDSTQAAKVPTQDLLQKAVSVTFSLLKPASTLTQPTALRKHSPSAEGRSLAPARTRSPRKSKPRAMRPRKRFTRCSPKPAAAISSWSAVTALHNKFVRDVGQFPHRTEILMLSRVQSLVLGEEHP